tara:strand:- start:1971 stop:2174 length:204 start_codon:yes stop_codon:yes gene_type:complete
MNKITIKDYINNSGYKQKWIAKQLGISSAMLSLQLKGLRKMKPLQASKLCEILKIPDSIYLNESGYI